MKVKDLLEELKEYDEDKEIEIELLSEGYYAIPVPIGDKYLRVGNVNFKEVVLISV